MKSLFDGWTPERQCFGPFQEGDKFCAIGWLRNASGYSDAAAETIRRVADGLESRFPELTAKAAGCYESDDREHRPTFIVVVANDQLRLHPEIFRSLDLDGQLLPELVEASLPESTEVR